MEAPGPSVADAAGPAADTRASREKPACSLVSQVLTAMNVPFDAINTPVGALKNPAVDLVPDWCFGGGQYLVAFAWVRNVRVRSGRTFQSFPLTNWPLGNCAAYVRTQRAATGIPPGRTRRRCGRRLGRLNRHPFTGKRPLTAMSPLRVVVAGADPAPAAVLAAGDVARAAQFVNALVTASTA